MRFRAVVTMVAASALAVLAMAFAPAERRAMDEGMCAPPEDDTTGWRVMQTVGISIRVPRAFAQIYRREDFVEFASSHRTITIRHGEGPDQQWGRGAMNLLSTCTTMIGGRPVSIVVEHFSVYDPPQNPSGQAGPEYVALARWRAISGLPTVTAWITSNDREDLHKLKGVFFTAEVGVKPCVEQSPLPAADSVIDSAAIAIAVASKPAPWPAGNVVIQLKFDSAGSLGAIAVTAGDLPDSTKRAVAMVVGTNVRERMLHAPSTVQLRVISANAGVSYAVEKAVVCPP